MQANPRSFLNVHPHDRTGTTAGDGGTGPGDPFPAEQTEAAANPNGNASPTHPEGETVVVRGQVPPSPAVVPVRRARRSFINNPR
jgi:hypothetical protein